MATTYELSITAEGQCFDADGNLLDPDGNPVETQDSTPDDLPSVDDEEVKP